MTPRRRYYIRGQLHEAYIVTEWRQGCVYRTEVVGEIVCRRNAPCLVGAGRLSALSTERTPAP